MNLISGLNQRFEIVTSSKTEYDFYNNVFYYFDYIFDHPELTNLYQKLATNYYQKHGDIWKDYNSKNDTDGDRRERETYNLERFDPYCGAIGLELRVYLPLKRYQDYKDPTNSRDFEAHLLAYGLDYALRRVDVAGISIPPKERKRQIKQTFYAWYHNQRDQYQRELTRFHLAFADEVEKLEVVEVPNILKNTPFLNLETGDFFYLGATGNFPISGQEFKILKTLQDNMNKPVSYLDLYKAIVPSATEVRETHKATIRNVLKNIKRKLGVLPKVKGSKKDPVKVIRQHGYELEL